MKMKKFDIIIIGGGPAGIVTASTAMKQYKDKSIALIQKEKKQPIPCGIPYIFHLLGDIEKNLMKRNVFNDEGKNLFIGTVSVINTEKKYVEFASGERLGYEKLVLATGSRPLVPEFLKPDRFKAGIEYVSKNYSELEKLKEKTDSAKKLLFWVPALPQLKWQSNCPRKKARKFI